MLNLVKHYRYLERIRLTSPDLRDSVYNRFVLLGLMGYGGIRLGEYANVKFFIKHVTQNMTVAEHWATVVIGIPVFIVLWYFRTYDARRQIEKAQAQFWQDYFNNAIENLTSGNILKEDIGINSLIKLSKTTSEFNELIIIAFESSIDKVERYKLTQETHRQKGIDIELNITYMLRQTFSERMIDELLRHKNSKEERDDKSL